MDLDVLACIPNPVRHPWVGASLSTNSSVTSNRNLSLDNRLSHGSEAMAVDVSGWDSTGKTRVNTDRCYLAHSYAASASLESRFFVDDGLWRNAPLLTGHGSFDPLPDVKNILVTGGEGFMQVLCNPWERVQPDLAQCFLAGTPPRLEVSRSLQCHLIRQAGLL